MCAAVAVRRLQAVCLMVSGGVTFAKLAAASWHKAPCGFIYTERGTVRLFIYSMRHINTAGKALD